MQLQVQAAIYASKDTGLHSLESLVYVVATMLRSVTSYQSQLQSTVTVKLASLSSVTVIVIQVSTGVHPPARGSDLGSGSAVGFSRWSPRWSPQTVIGSTEFLPFYFMYRPYFVYRPDEAHGPLGLARGSQCRVLSIVRVFPVLFFCWTDLGYFGSGVGRGYWRLYCLVVVN